MTTELGVRARTGEPIGPAGLEIANVARVGVAGLFTRTFKSAMFTDNPKAAAVIAGGHRSDMYGSRMLESLLKNSNPAVVNLNIASWCPSDAVSASVTLQDGAGGDTIIVRDAYRGVRGYGVDGNQTGVKVSHFVKASSRIDEATTAAPSEIKVTAIRDFGIGDVLRITSGGSSHETVVTALNLETRTLTIDGTGFPALALDDLVEAVSFRIAAYRRSPSGEEVPARLPMDRANLSLEPEDLDGSITQFAESHPYFELISAGSAQTGLQRFPVETSGVVWLTGGATGTMPAAPADWNGLQVRFDTIKVFFVLLADTFNASVLASWEEWARNRLDHPLVFAPLAYRDSDWTTLGEFGEQFVVGDGWRQLILFYGWRYWPDETVRAARRVSKIPVCAAVLGRWMAMIYTGDAHRVPAEPRFELRGFTTGPDSFPEDAAAVESALRGGPSDRDRLYAKGINLTRRHLNGVRARNFRTVSDDVRVRDGNIHVTSSIIKEFVEVNFKREENTPLKRSELERIVRDIKSRILKPMHEGNLPPFYNAETKGVGRGPFADALPDGSPAKLDDVVRILYGLDVNPEVQFRQGIVKIIISFVPAALMTSMEFVTAPAIEI